MRKALFLSSWALSLGAFSTTAEARITGLARCESHTHPEALVFGKSWVAGRVATRGESVPVSAPDQQAPSHRHVLDLETQEAYFQVLPFEGVNYLSVRAKKGSYPKRIFRVPAEKLFEPRAEGEPTLYPSDLSLLTANASGSLIAIGHRYSDLDAGVSHIEVLIYRAQDLIPLRASSRGSIVRDLPDVWANFSFTDEHEAPRVERVLFSRDAKEIRVFVNLNEDGAARLYFGGIEIPSAR